MEITEVLSSLALVTVPAVIVLYASYLTFKTFLGNDIEKKLLDNKSQISEKALPYRLQAYERMALFLERISPGQLINRLADSSLNVMQFQHLLIREIREEFNHNLSQQIYMSDESWELIRSAVEDSVTVINNISRELEPTQSSSELARFFLESEITHDKNQIEVALSYIKEEIRTIY